MIRIGTSGWSYKSWLDRFYQGNPEDLNLLELYARTFDTVEINNTFYNLPARKSVQNWHDLTDDNFIFSCKASRYITHMKKLKTDTRKFFDAITLLGEKLGPILFQLPPRWHINLGRLEKFMSGLPSGYRYVFEFRDQSWMTEDVYRLLRYHKAAFCVYHLAGYKSPEIVTADFCYVRLHGPGKSYQGSYNSRTLQSWADKFINWEREGRDVYCYFDNDEKSYAARDALRLLGKLESYYPTAPSRRRSAITGKWSE